jgi:putative ABC transport system permease protein
MPLVPLILASLWQNKGRVLVSVVAIALGVALGYAVHAINAAAVNEFGQALQAVSGEADLTVRGPRSGFDEAVYANLARMPEVAVASPMLEVDARVAGRDEPLHMLGIDVFRAVRIQPALVGEGTDRLDPLRPDMVFLSPQAAHWLSIDAGDTLRVQVGLSSLVLRVAGVLTGGGQRLGVMDVGAMQWRLHRMGVLTRIDLRLKPGVDTAAFSARLQTVLPAGVFVETPRAALDSTLRMSRAYRVNLTVLALVALFTGALLVFATEALAVVRRRSELALLRVLGMTRGGLLRLLGAESLLMGAIGAALGVVTGHALASIVLRSVGADLGAGFFSGFEPQLRMEWQAIALYASAGMAAALLGGLVPTLEAARAHPASALKAGDEQMAYRQLRAPRAALVLLVLGAILVALPPVNGLPLFGYGAITLMLIGTIGLIPWLSALVFARLRLPRGAIGELALAQLRGASAQTAIGMAAIVASVSLMVAMAIMVTSFRDSLDQWLGRMLPADLYVRANVAGDTGFIDAPAQQAMTALSGIARVEFLRSQQIVLDATRSRVTLLARDLSARGAENVLPVVSPVVLPSADQPPAIWISEAIADLYAFTPGQRVQVPLSGRSVEFTVAGVWRDYVRQNGALVIDRPLYAQITGDPVITDAALWLASGVNASDVTARLRSAIAGGAMLEISAPGEIKRLSLSIFDRTFAVTYALEACAVIIGLFGLSSSVAGQVLARRREFGMLRHIGMTRRQVSVMLSLEGVLSGALGLGTGLLLGWAISLVLIHVVNRQSFHWSMEMHLPWSSLALFAAAMLLLATVVAAVSGRSARGKDVIRAVKDDW